MKDDIYATGLALAFAVFVIFTVVALHINRDPLPEAVNPVFEKGTVVCLKGFQTRFLVRGTRTFALQDETYYALRAEGLESYTIAESELEVCR